MKLGILGPANSIHTIKLVNKLVENKFEVVLISLLEHRNKGSNINADVRYLRVGGNKGYYLNFKQLKSLIISENVDILNAHYASGYGTLGRLINFHPYIVSVWGSDIYEFPRRNILCKRIIMKNLRKADSIFSTSRCMAFETKKYCDKNKKIAVTPFGVDLNTFKPVEKTKSHSQITIGFLKGTDYVYGIDIFLEVARELKLRLKKEACNLKVIICGGGTRIDEIKGKIEALKLEDIVEFKGLVPHIDMPSVINSCDIVCIPSLSESFGVVAIEAMACGVPCITSNAPGLKEVVRDGETGFVINGDSIQYADKMINLINDRAQIVRMGEQARRHVEKNYNFNDNVKEYISALCECYDSMRKPE